MTGIRTNAAARMLGVSPNTLRSWERRYGFPMPRRSAGNQRQFALAQIEALKETMGETHNVSSAIALARARGEGPSSSRRLASAFAAFDEGRADRLLEESLALRSVERTVEDVLLSAVSALASDAEPSTPEYHFASRYAAGWLGSLGRLAPPASREQAALLFDATVPGGVDALHVEALVLVLRRSGLRTLSLPLAVNPARLGRAVRALNPAAIVLSGPHTPLEQAGRLVHAVRRTQPVSLVCDYRGAVPDRWDSAVCRLGDSVLGARDRLLERLDAPAA
jgi:DNA-binding transcriptional MerR regulator